MIPFSRGAIGRRGTATLVRAAGGLGGLQRAVLRLLSRDYSGATVSALALTRHTPSVLPGHALQVLKTLQRRGLVEREDGAGFRVRASAATTGWRLTALGSDVMDRRP